MEDLQDVEDDPFVILGVSRDCSSSELRQAYRLLARRYHPDINAGPEAAAQMSRINLAYDRALEQVKRRARIRLTQGASMTVVAERHTMSGFAGAPQAAPFRRRRRSWRRTTHWRAFVIAALAILVPGALAILVASRVGALPWQTAGGHQARTQTQTSNLVTLQLDGVTQARWQDGGAVTFAERRLSDFAPNQRLNDPPQWSRNGEYMAVSLAPARDTTNAKAVILLLRDTQVVATIPAIQARWSPVDDQLALLTDPDASGSPQLELLSLLSPTTLSAPLVLDAHAGTHLAWSQDGRQIAYSADGQQQLRLASIALHTHQTLVKVRGARLIPVGWQGGSVVEIAHVGGAVTLARIDTTLHKSTTLAYVDATATGATVIVTRTGVGYVAQAPATPFMTLYWNGAAQQQQQQQPWQTQLLGVETVRFLAGWSPDTAWIALSPNPSGVRTSEICLARAPAPQKPPPAQWQTHCLRLPGIVLGMNWAPYTNTLGYIRMAQPGSALELRELRIGSPQTHTSSDPMRASLRASFAGMSGAPESAIVFALAGLLPRVERALRRHLPPTRATNSFISWYGEGDP